MRNWIFFYRKKENKKTKKLGKKKHNNSKHAHKNKRSVKSHLAGNKTSVNKNQKAAMEESDISNTYVFYFFHKALFEKKRSSSNWGKRSECLPLL